MTGPGHAGMQAAQEPRAHLFEEFLATPERRRPIVCHCDRWLQREEGEGLLLFDHPCMFRAHPFLFLGCVAVAPLWGLGAVLLLAWMVVVLNSSLVVTSSRTVLRRGVLAKETFEVFHADVRAIEARQGLVERITDVGWLGVASAGHAGIEIRVSGIANPLGVKRLIEEHRKKGATNE